MSKHCTTHSGAHSFVKVSLAFGKDAEVFSCPTCETVMLWEHGHWVELVRTAGGYVRNPTPPDPNTEGDK